MVLNTNLLSISQKTDLKVNFELQSFIQSLKTQYDTDSYNIPLKSMTLQNETSRWKIQMLVRRVGGYYQKDSSYKVNNFESLIMIKKK